MQLVYLAAAITSLLSVSIASPVAAPVELVPRACSTRTPSTYVISSADPNNPGASNNIQLARAGPPYSNTKNTVLIFSGFPDGATGCQLKYTLPKGTFATANPDQNGAFQADTWLLKPGRIPTWNTPPVHSQMVGTIRFPTGAQTSTFETTVWAGNCPSNNVPRDGPYASQLQFSLEVSDWQQFAGTVNLAEAPPGSGFYVIYNC